MRFLSFLSLIFAIYVEALPSVADLTLEEKVGQLLMVHFRGESPNEEARLLIQEQKVGGVVYYNWANGLNSWEQVSALSCGLQALAQENRTKIPLFIGVDQEGGRVARLKNGFTSFPSNKIIGETKNPLNSEKAAYTIGSELRHVGINLNFAPVIDINSNPNNPIIGDRAFGSDPKTVIDFGKSALLGYKRATLFATLKHYPGHGDAAVDSHQDLPVVNKPLIALKEMELLPFEALAPEADFVMTAHIRLPALDPKNCATLSKQTLSYLRDTLGFKGVIITDSLVMKGVLKECQTVDQAALLALNAGCDILLLGGALLNGTAITLEVTQKDVKRIHQFLVESIKKGIVPEDRVNEAVARILEKKQQL